MLDQDSTSIEATLDRVKYRHATGGWKILIVKHKGKNLTITGTFGSLQEGSYYKFHGSFDDHPKYGNQFKSVDYEELHPRDINQIIRYLETRMTGIGLVKALEIGNHFGEQTLDIIEKSPERLVEVNGINEKLANDIHKQFMSIKGESAIKVKLTGYGLTQFQVDLLYEKYGDEILDIFEANPYWLIRDLDGFAFKRVDLMALRSGFVQHDSQFRIVAGIEYVVDSLLTGEGHTYLPIDKFLKMAAKELEVANDVVEKQIDYVALTERIIVDELNGEKIICNVKLYDYETQIAECLKQLYANAQKEDPIEVPDEILEPCRGLQVDAVINSLKYPISIITGPPGSGKTWTLKQILKCLDGLGMKVSMAAPTGKAAKRMKESIEQLNRDCKTIHMLLGYHPKEGFRVNKQFPLKSDVLIVDEFSMSDTELSYNLFEACHKLKRIIIIGDVDQLPSVGPGMVMKALMGSKLIHTTRLTQIQRQASGSGIVVNANKINNGKEINYEFEEGNDFAFIERETKEEIRDLIPVVVRKAAEKYGFDPVTDIQVLCPQKKTPIGSFEINEILRKMLNPNAKTKDFAVGDKVIQTKNNYTLQIYNGDTGIIKEISKTSNELVIDFGYDELTYYPVNKKKELQLAYAITVHKSQGSEFPMVIIPIHTCNYMMLQRNLLYTAVTRGRQKVVIIGTPKAVKLAVRNAKPTKRYNRLEHLLK